jgi:RecA-family ATPase
MSRAEQIHKAVRTGQKARVALSGPSGSGKTWTALSIATELANGGPILSTPPASGPGATSSPGGRPALPPRTHWSRRC